MRFTLTLALCLVMVSAARAQITPSPYWSSTVQYATTPFAVIPLDPNDPHWVKFSIFLSHPSDVYFQDSNHYPFHYDFATERLDPYLGIDRSTFNSITLLNSGQQLQLGAVLFPPQSNLNTGPREFAIQFIRTDPIAPQAIVDFFNTVKSKVTFDGTPPTALYFPTFEQQDTANANAAFFAANGITVSSAARWTEGNRCYSAGWALGTVRFVTASQVQAAYNAGTLRPDDILLTDGVPAELPLVAGIISLAPVTANSHTVLLAQTYASPMVYLALAGDVANAQSLIGRKALLSSYIVSDLANITLVDVQDSMTPEFEAQLQTLHAPGTIQYTPMEANGSYSLNTEGLHPSDVKYVGGKAANYGFLRRAIPANARPAGAFTFDVWNEFMSQELANTRTLRQEIHARLDQYHWPPNFQQLTTSLATVRDLFTNTSSTRFSPALSSAIIAALQDAQYGFDPDIKIRFRSSTNVEDLSGFTGAGLYDSFSGCLHDDTDSDTTGPSWCDPTDSGEKGVYRAIRKVYASFYNDNAFIQRLRAGVNEDQVGMGLLFHHSFPDPTEMANGVVLWDRAPSPSHMYFVSQIGANSITNPTNGATPEEVTFDYYGGDGFAIANFRTSSMVVLGETVMPEFPDAHVALGLLFSQVGDRITTETGNAASTLDFEFKRVAPFADLDIKQVRQIPTPSTTPSITPALVSVPTSYCLFQGEYGNVFSNHRLKAQLTLTNRNTMLTPQNLTSSLYTAGSLTFNDGCSVQGMTGAPASFPGASYAYAGGTATDGWTLTSLPNPTSFSLATANIPTLVSASQSPVLTPRDLGIAPRSSLTLSATHQRAVPTVDLFSNFDTATSESALLCPCAHLVQGPQQQRHYVLSDGVVVDTVFYWTQPPLTPTFLYTTDLASWDHTTITGLTTDPITLHSYFSQTYRPGHHNYQEFFVFEPRLDPGVTAAQLAELAARGIDLIYVFEDHWDGVSRIQSAYLGDNGNACPRPCSADFNGDGDVGTDADIEAFFACLAGNCCATCWGADFNADGDTGTDADIEAFFRVLAGGAC